MIILQLLWGNHRFRVIWCPINLNHHVFLCEKCAQWAGSSYKIVTVPLTTKKYYSLVDKGSRFIIHMANLVTNNLYEVMGTRHTRKGTKTIRAIKCYKLCGNSSSVIYKNKRTTSCIWSDGIHEHIETRFTRPTFFRILFRLQIQPLFSTRGINNFLPVQVMVHVRKYRYYWQYDWNKNNLERWFANNPTEIGMIMHNHCGDKACAFREN